MNKETLLIVDDDEELRNLVKKNLQRSGFTNVLTAADAKAALQLLNKTQIDLILLDIMMPEIDGFSLLKSIRKSSDIPVILLTAKGEAEDKYIGFEYGADDYVVKPFLIRELVLRIRAVLRRIYPERESEIRLGDTVINLATAEVTRDKSLTHLTGRELEILNKLYQNANRIVSAPLLCQSVIGEIWSGYESTLATHIRHIREKIEEDPSHPKHLLTVRGLGYRLVL